jgi:hypothetical protein
MDGNKEDIKNGIPAAVIGELLTDVITCRPHDFRVGGTTYYLWPVTMAKNMLLKPFVETLGLGAGKAHGAGGVLELMIEQARERRAECAMVLSILTMENTRTAFYDYLGREQRAEYFGRELSDADLARLLATGLMGNHLQLLSEHFGMDREHERLTDALRAKKKTKNSLSFGSVSVLGGDIASLMEMGFSYDEVVFERSYDLLRLMLLDKPVSLWLSDDELDSMGGSAGALIDGESDNADQQLLAFFAGKGVKVVDGATNKQTI